MAPLISSPCVVTSPRSRIDYYCYSDLSKDIDQIRIVQVFPEEDDRAEIKCSLSSVPLDNPPPYSALSYTWDKATELTQITIDGELALITPNLEAALRALRQKKGDLFIWVDAICINQNDILERSAQVTKMKNIYERAKEVHVWLGKGDDGSVKAWDLIEGLLRSKESARMIVQDRARFDYFQSLKDLFRRSYWWRIWVVQEVTCGQDVIAHCGQQRISWKDLESVCDILHDEKEDLVQIQYPDDATSVNSLLTGGPKGLKLSRSVAEDELPSLLDLLYSHKSKMSTDPRDKVYALVGMCATHAAFGKIDYERSLVDTYIHTAKHIISTTQKLDVICMSQNDENFYGLPSWVPDWERRNEFPKHRQVGLHIRRSRFKAAGDSTPVFQFSRNDNILTTTGYIIDSLNLTGIPFRLAGDHKAEAKVIQTLHTFADWWTKFIAIKGITDASREEFQRSMCGGAWKPKYEHFEYSQRLQVFCRCLQRLVPGNQLVIPSFHDESSIGSDAEQRALVSAASLRMHAKRLAISWQDRLTCLVPWSAEKWDLVCVLRGCSFPVVLRKHEEFYELIGEAYVDGIMYGEKFNEQEKRCNLMTFPIR